MAPFHVPVQFMLDAGRLAYGAALAVPPVLSRLAMLERYYRDRSVGLPARWWTGNGVLDRFLEDESLFGEFLRTPVSEGGVEPLVVGPPHVVVEVGA